MNKHTMIKVILKLYACNGAESAESCLVSEEDWAIYTGKVPAALNAEHLGTYAWESAVEFASGYGIYPMSDMPEDFDEDEDQSGYGQDEYSDDISGHFELYDPKEHDGLRIGGGDWDWKEI